MLHILRTPLSKRTFFVMAGVIVALAAATGFAFAQAGENATPPPPVHTIKVPAGQRVTSPGSSTVSAPSPAQLKAAQDATQAQGQRGAPLGPVAQNGAGRTGEPVVINRGTTPGGLK